MKFVNARPYADPEVAAGKIVERANSFDTVPNKDGPRSRTSGKLGTVDGDWGIEGATVCRDPSSPDEFRQCVIVSPLSRPRTCLPDVRYRVLLRRRGGGIGSSPRTTPTQIIDGATNDQ
jgi:hypothetical protein